MRRYIQHPFTIFRLFQVILVCDPSDEIRCDPDFLADFSRRTQIIGRLRRRDNLAAADKLCSAGIQRLLKRPTLILLLFSRRSFALRKSVCRSAIAASRLTSSTSGNR